MILLYTGDTIPDVHNNVNFTYPFLISALRRQSSSPHVRCLAGCALATLAYNSIARQDAIAASTSVTAASPATAADARLLLGVSGERPAPLRFADFEPMLFDETDDLIRCRTAFQVCEL